MPSASRPAPRKCSPSGSRSTRIRRPAPGRNAALRQTGRTDAALTAETWRTAVAEKLEALDWDRAAADVRPFLERSDDAALVTKQNALRLLLARRGYSPPSLGRG